MDVGAAESAVVLHLLCCILLLLPYLDRRRSRLKIFALRDLNVTSIPTTPDNNQNEAAVVGFMGDCRR